MTAILYLAMLRPVTVHTPICTPALDVRLGSYMACVVERRVVGWRIG